MKTAVSLSGGYGSAYNLWQLARDTSDEIVAIFVNIDYYRNNYQKDAEPRGVRATAESIANWVSLNVRPIQFIVLSLDNYDPKYSGYPALEIVNYAKDNSFDNVVFNDDVKDELTTHQYIRNAVGKIKESVNVSYPIRDNNKINYQITKELPFALLALCTTNAFFQPSVTMENSGSTIEEIKQKQLSVVNKTARNENSEWVSTDDVFGEINFGLSVRGTHKQLIDLWI
jgi:hypothetical protein